MTTLGCKVKRTEADAFKAYAAQQGKTGNTLLKEYVMQCIGALEATGQKVSMPATQAPVKDAETAALLDTFRHSVK